MVFKHSSCFLGVQNKSIESSDLVHGRIYSLTETSDPFNGPAVKSRIFGQDRRLLVVVESVLHRGQVLTVRHQQLQLLFLQRLHFHHA